MKLVNEEIEWIRDRSSSHVAFTARGKVSDGTVYVLVVAFSTELACWTTFVALDGSQIHASESEEQTVARSAAEYALQTALRIRS